MSLRRQVDTLRITVQEQRQDIPSRITWGRSWQVDEASGSLPDDTDVSFVIAQTPTRRIWVRLTADGLYVNGDGILQIICESSNCFTIQERRR